MSSSATTGWIRPSLTSTAWATTKRRCPRPLRRRATTRASSWAKATTRRRRPRNGRRRSPAFPSRPSCVSRVKSARRSPASSRRAGVRSVRRTAKKPPAPSRCSRSSRGTSVSPARTPVSTKGTSPSRPSIFPWARTPSRPRFRASSGRTRSCAARKWTTFTTA